MSLSSGTSPGTTGRTLPTPRALKVLDGLERLFLAEGFRRLTVADLAARLHCSRRTLYSLAPSKEELFELVLDRLLCRIDSLGRACMESGGGLRQRITGFAAPGFTELANANAVLFADIAGHPPARQRLAEHQEARRVQLQGLLEEGIRAGVFRQVHAHLAAELMLAAYRCVVDPAFLGSVDLSLSEAVREAEDLLLNGLFHPEG